MAGQPDPELPRLAYTVHEAAKMLSVSHWTLRRIIKEKRIQTFRINSSILITRKALEDFVNGSVTD